MRPTSHRKTKRGIHAALRATKTCMMRSSYVEMYRRNFTGGHHNYHLMFVGDESNNWYKMDNYYRGWTANYSLKTSLQILLTMTRACLEIILTSSKKDRLLLLESFAEVFFPNMGGWPTARKDGTYNPSIHLKPVSYNSQLFTFFCNKVRTRKFTVRMQIDLFPWSIIYTL